MDLLGRETRPSKAQRKLWRSSAELPVSNCLEKEETTKTYNSNMKVK